MKAKTTIIYESLILAQDECQRRLIHASRTLKLSAGKSDELRTVSNA